MERAKQEGQFFSKKREHTAIIRKHDKKLSWKYYILIIKSVTCLYRGF